MVKPIDTKDRGIGCEILPKEADHTKCKDSVRHNESTISDLKRQIENYNKNLKNEQTMLKNMQVFSYRIKVLTLFSVIFKVWRKNGSTKNTSFNFQLMYT